MITCALTCDSITIPLSAIGSRENELDPNVKCRMIVVDPALMVSGWVGVVWPSRALAGKGHRSLL